MTKIVLGICAGIASSACTSLGMITHRLFIQRYAPPGASLIPFRINIVWLVGVILFLGAVLLDALALVFAPVAVVGALTVTNLIFNTLFAYMCVGETATMSSCTSVLLMMAGCFIVISSHVGADTQDSHPDNLKGAIVFVGEARRSVPVVVATLVCGFVPFFAERLEDANKGILYAALAGVNATNFLLIGKFVMTLLQTSSVDALTKLEWWIAIMTLSVFGFVNIFVQLAYVIRSLRVISTVLVSNIFTASSVISSILFAGLVLDEFEFYQMEQWLFLSLGTLMTVLGVFLLKDSTVLKKSDSAMIPSPDAL